MVPLDSHDDCIMTAAISVHVAQTMHYDENEPMAEARRRRAEEEARKLQASGGVVLTRVNTDWTDDEDKNDDYREWNDGGEEEPTWP
jgi:hypothetical protein